MKQKSLLAFIKAIVHILIGAIFGGVAGLLIYKYIFPFWTFSSIGTVPKDALGILFVDYQYDDALHLDSNTIYVQSQSGDVYFGYQNNWEFLTPLPNGHTISQIMLLDYGYDEPILVVADQSVFYHLIGGEWRLLRNHTGRFRGITPYPCSKEWHLPVFQAVDSAGAVFDHALASEYVCYVLFSDGRLQVWTRRTDAFTLLGTFTTSILIGMVIGYKAVSIINIFKRKP